MVTALNCGYYLKTIKIINQFFFIIKFWGYVQGSALAASGPCCQRGLGIAAPPPPAQGFSFTDPRS